MAPAAAQTSFWSNAIVPGTQEVGNDSASVTVGLKFQSDVPGSVTAVRFYKGPHNTGTHVGSLWSAAGIKLATVTFSGETASGWQQANFSSPVSIAANTTYVVSYLAPKGYYAVDQSYSWSSLSAAPLHVSGSSPGVFAYGSGATFPNGTWNSSNYYVDMVFTPATGTTPTSTYSISGKVTGSAATLTLSGAASKSATTDTAGNYNFSGLTNGSYTVAPSQSGRTFSPANAAVTVNGANVSGVNFTSTQATSIWNNSTVPGTPSDSDTSSVELGLKFSSGVPGSIVAVRFYKGQSNTGTHIGNLWTGTGTNLARVTFAGETPSGWQQQNFSSPISIAANTTYVISYFAPKGSYAADEPYSWSTLNAAPLHVSGTSPGVFAYGSGSSFPSGTWNFSNYFVDLVFVPSSSSGSSTPPPSTYSISGTVTGSAATLTLSGAASATTTTNSAGSYSFSGLTNGTYLVAPSQSGYTFTPSTASASVDGANIAGANFTAIAAAPSSGGGGGGGTTPPMSHGVSLSWTASTSSNISGYKVYRAMVSGGPYTQIDASLITGTSYVDNSVTSGTAYFYVTTCVDVNNVESRYSNEATAVIPTP